MQFIIVSNIAVPFDWSTTGGSEEYHTQLCEQLVSRGHSVRSYAPLPVKYQTVLEISYNGVSWSDLRYLDRSLPGVWIIQRDPALVLNWDRLPDRTQSLFFAAHDFEYDTPHWPDLFDAILTDSEIHASYLRRVYHHPRIVSTGVGPNLARIGEVPVVERNPRRILWSSSYVRGLEYLLMIYERALDRVPDLELAVTYGWDSIDVNRGDHLKKFKDRVTRKMEELKITHLGRLPSSVSVWTEFSRSGLWVFPTQWPETGCQSIMEAQCFGAIPIYTPFWALSENGLYGTRIYGDPYTDRLVRARFVEEVVELASDPDRQESVRAGMMKDARERFGFSGVVDRVENLALTIDLSSAPVSV